MGDLRFGFSTHFGQPTGNSKLMLPVLAQTGVGWIRDNVSWANFNPSTGVFQVYALDNGWIIAAGAAGLQVVAVIGSNANVGTNPPYDPTQMGAFAAWLSGQYAGIITAIEVVNEPNNISNFNTSGGETTYQTLVSTVTAAVNAGPNPSCQVIGLDYQGNTILSHLAGATMDGVVYHPYDPGTSPNVVPELVFEPPYNTFTNEYPQWIAALSSATALPKWETEWGCAAVSGLTQDMQACYIARRMLLAAAFGVDHTFIYSYIDLGTDGYGVAVAGSPVGAVVQKQAYTTVTKLISVLQGVVGSTSQASASQVTLSNLGTTYTAPVMPFSCLLTGPTDSVTAFWIGNASVNAPPASTTVTVAFNNAFTSRSSYLLDIVAGTQVPLSNFTVSKVGSTMTVSGLPISDHPQLIVLSTMATWNSNGAPTGGSGSYVSGTQSVKYIHDTFAANGDTITIPSGTFTWTSGVAVTKSISIVSTTYTPNTTQNNTTPGAPTLSTVINYTPTSGNAFTVTSATTGANFFRLSGIHFTGAVSINTPSTALYIQTTGTTTTDPWRIDNCIIDGANNSSVVMVNFFGNPVGCVMDHCTLIGGSACEMIHNSGLGPGDTVGWQDNIIPGSNQLIYMEDCLWTTPNFNTITGGTSARSGIETYYGGRNGIRWSSFQLVQIDQHGNTDVGTRWFEFYDLLFYQGAATGATGAVTDLDLRGGSGFVYNISSNPASSTQHIQFYSDQATPCIYGPGNGIFVSGAGHVPDNSSPVYLWNFPTSFSVDLTQNAGVSGPNDIALNRNYFPTPSLASQPTNMTVWQTNSGAVSNFVYTSFVYPHPLIAQTSGGGGGGDTTPPTVSLTAPSAGTVSGTITVSATASDNVGVVGVQFKLDGSNLGSEDLTSPYSFAWDTTGASNGSHVLTATARDAAGNTTTSSGVTVTVANAGGTGVPVLINHVATGMDILPVQTFRVNFPDPVLAGNCLVVFTQCESSGGISSVIDSLGNNFTKAASFSNAAVGRQGACWVLPNATSGVTGVVISYSGFNSTSGGSSNACPHADISQWANIATVLPVDAANTSISSKSVALTAAAGHAPSANGDLILHWAFDLSDTNSGGNFGGAFNGTSIVKGTGFNLLTADRQVGSVVQYLVQTTAADITPTCTTSGAATWGSIAIALKSALAGNVPPASQMRIVSVYHCSFAGNTSVLDVNSRPITQISTIQFPTTGNLIVGSYQAEGAISGVTDNTNPAWQIPSTANITSTDANQTSQFVYAPNSTPNLALSATFTFANGASGTSYGLIVLYDVINAPVSPFDSGAENQATPGSGGNLTTPTQTTMSISPRTANGLVFSMFCVSWNTVDSCNLSTGGGANSANPFILDSVVNNLGSNNTGTLGTPASPLDEDAGICHIRNTTTAPITFIYGENNTGNTGGGESAGPGVWSTAVIAFFGPVGGSAVLAVRDQIKVNVTGNLSVPVMTGTVACVQHVATGMDNNIVGDFLVPFPHPTLTGNSLIACVQFNSAGALAATPITDDKNNAWVVGPTFTGSGKEAHMFFAPVAAVGTRLITFHITGLTATIGCPQAVISEWANLSAIDVSSSSATSKSSGSITPLAAGDLIYQWGIDLGDNANGPAWNGTALTPGSGFTLLSADRQVGSIEQYQIQGAATPVNPTFTTTGGGAGTWGSLAVAIKADNTGTLVPTTGIRIFGIQSTSLTGGLNVGGPTVINSLQFPSQGNLLVATFQSFVHVITGITDNQANTWTVRPAVTTSGSYVAQIAYAKNANTDPLLANLALTFSGTAGYDILMLYDVLNANTAAPFDTTADASITNKTGQLSTNTNLTTCSITPTILGELIISTIVLNNNTIISTVGAGLLSDVVSNSLVDNSTGPTGTPPSSLQEDGGYAHAISTTLSPISFVYSLNYSQVSGGLPGAGTWSSAAAAFFPSGALPSLPLAGPVAINTASTAKIKVTVPLKGVALFKASDTGKVQLPKPLASHFSAKANVSNNISVIHSTIVSTDVIKAAHTGKLASSRKLAGSVLGDFNPLGNLKNVKAVAGTVIINTASFGRTTDRLASAVSVNVNLTAALKSAAPLKGSVTINSSNANTIKVSRRFSSVIQVNTANGLALTRLGTILSNSIASSSKAPNSQPVVTNNANDLLISYVDSTSTGLVSTFGMFTEESPPATSSVFADKNVSAKGSFNATWSLPVIAPWADLIIAIARVGGVPGTTGSLLIIDSYSGTAAAQAANSATLTMPIGFAGVAVADAAFTAKMSSNRVLSGNTVAKANIHDAISTQKKFFGNVTASVVIQSAHLSINAPMASHANAKFSLSGSLVQIHCAGSITINSNSTALIRVVRPEAGNVTAKAAHQASTVRVVRPLAGSSTGKTSVTISLTEGKQVAGSISAKTSLTGLLSNQERTVGAVIGDINLTGLLRATKNVFSTVTAKANDHAALKVTNRLVGSVTIQIINAGTVTYGHACTGVAKGSAAHTANLAAGKIPAGTATGTVTLTASIRVQKSVFASASAKGSVHAALTESNRLTASISAKANLTGRVIASTIQSVVTMRASHTARLIEGNPIADTVIGHLTLTALLKMSDALRASASAKAAHQGILFQIKPLAGSVSIAANHRASTIVGELFISTASIKAANAASIRVTRRQAGSVLIQGSLTALIRASKLSSSLDQIKAAHTASVVLTNKLTGSAVIQGSLTGSSGSARRLNSSLIGTVTASSALRVVKPTVGTVIGKGVLSNALSKPGIVAGNALLRATLIGLIRASQKLAATSHGTMIASGLVRASKIAASTSSSHAVLSANIQISRLEAGSASGTVIILGQVRATHLLAGSVIINTANVGNSSTLRPLAGSIEIDGIISPSLSSGRKLASSASILAANQGRLAATKKLAGSVTLHAVNAGFVGITVQLAGAHVTASAHFAALLKVSHFDSSIAIAKASNSASLAVSVVTTNNATAQISLSTQLTAIPKALHGAASRIALTLSAPTLVPQALHRATDLLSIQSSLNPSVQSIHRATALVTAQALLSEVATKLNNATSHITLHNTLVEIAQSIHQASILLAPHASISAPAGLLHRATMSLIIQSRLNPNATAVLRATSLIALKTQLSAMWLGVDQVKASWSAKYVRQSISGLTNGAVIVYSDQLFTWEV